MEAEKASRLHFYYKSIHFYWTYNVPNCVYCIIAVLQCLLYNLTEILKVSSVQDVRLLLHIDLYVDLSLFQSYTKDPIS